MEPAQNKLPLSSDEQELYKRLVDDNWKWSIFHDQIAPYYKGAAAVSGLFLVLILGYLYNHGVGVHIDFSKKQEAQVVSTVNFSQEVTKFFDVPVAPVSLTLTEFAEKYYSDVDLQKLEDTILADLNSTGKVSVDHIDIRPDEYAARAQTPDFMQIKISDDIIVFSVITYSAQLNRMGRFIAIARKLDKWRLVVIKTPSESKNVGNLFSKKDTSEKIYNAITIK